MSKEEININQLTSPTITEKTRETEIFPECKIMYAISMTIMQLLSENHSKPTYKEKLKSQKKQIFTSRSIPKISISDYLNRIMKYTKIEESTLTIALIYVDRICKKKKILLTEFNAHRLLFTGVLVAIKYNEDKFYSNNFYAKIGGMGVKELNQIEEEFLVGINFDLFVEYKMFEKYESTLIKSSFQQA